MTVELHDSADSTTTPHMGGKTPCYASFTSIRTLLDTLREGGLPAQFDRSYFGAASGGLIAQTRGTLRFLDLIDDDYRPTPQLAELVAADEEGRRAILRRLAKERYVEEITLAGQNGTTGQLLTVFKERGLSGATAQKAATFYIHLAQHVGLPVSQYFTQSRGASSGNGTTRRATRRRNRPAVPDVQTVPPQDPAETLDK
ncbi:MAG: hypothetical protein ACREX8_17745 [Gammaproteobacteria bacterium]